MGAVTAAVAPGYHVGTTVPVSFTWSATGSVTKYAVWITSDNGIHWNDATSRLASPTAKSVAFGLTPGTGYRLGVAAYDAQGKRSDYVYSNIVTPRVFDDSSASTSNGWMRYAWTDAYGGQGLTSSTAGAAVQFRFTGSAVALVAPKFSGAGSAEAFVDGTSVGTVNLQAANRDPRAVVFSRFWNTSGTHTVTFKLVGSARFDVDAFAVLA